MPIDLQTGGSAPPTTELFEPDVPIKITGLQCFASIELEGSFLRWNQFALGETAGVGVFIDYRDPGAPAA